MTRQSTGVLSFYRVVKTDPPSIEDFLSAEELGRELSNPTPDRRRHWQGLSVYDTEERARKKAIRVPLLGAFIAGWRSQSAAQFDTSARRRAQDTTRFGATPMNSYDAWRRSFQSNGQRMPMAYELWDTDSANLIGDFPTEDDALRAVRQTIRARGLGAVATLALAVEDEDGETHPVASGTVLAERARDSSSTRSRLAG